MNIYEDYINYMNEHSDLIEKLYSTNSQAIICIDDVIRVNDYIYQQNEQGEEISKELEEIFEVGFGYLVNSINDLEIYYKDHLNEDIILFNQYSPIIIYAILIEDYKSYLISNDEYDKEYQEIIEKLLSSVDEIITNKLNFTDETLQKYSDELEKVYYYEKFKPAYSVFAMIAEELEIY